MNSSLFTLNPYARVREEKSGILKLEMETKDKSIRARARGEIHSLFADPPKEKISIHARARGAFGRVWIYRVGRVDYPCVSGALRDVYNGVETPPFKPYLYTHVREEKRQFWLVSVKRYTYPYTRVRGEKRCTAHFDSFHAGYPYAYE